MLPRHNPVLVRVRLQDSTYRRSRKQLGRSSEQKPIPDRTGGNSLHADQGRRGARRQQRPDTPGTFRTLECRGDVSKPSNGRTPMARNEDRRHRLCPKMQELRILGSAPDPRPSPDNVCDPHGRKGAHGPCRPIFRWHPHVDDATKWVETFQTPGTGTTHAIRALEEWISRWGPISKICVDNAAAWNSFDFYRWTMARGITELLPPGQRAGRTDDPNSSPSDASYVKRNDRSLASNH